MDMKEELQEIRLRIETLEGKMQELLPFADPPPPDRRADHHRNQMIYDRLDPMSTTELKMILGKVRKNYDKLFDQDHNLITPRDIKLERLYNTIEIRISENLKLWR